MHIGSNAEVMINIYMSDDQYSFEWGALVDYQHMLRN